MSYTIWWARPPAWRLSRAPGDAPVSDHPARRSRCRADPATHQGARLPDPRRVEEALAVVARRVEGLEPGEWLTGSGWHTGNWGVEEWPTAAALDRVAPDNPVSLVGMNSHASWLNSEALEAAAITKDLPDPADGIILRDPETDLFR